MMKGQPEDGVADATKGGAGEPEVDMEAEGVVQMDVETDVKNDQTVTVQTRAQAGGCQWVRVVQVIVVVLMVGVILSFGLSYGLYLLYISHKMATSELLGNGHIIGVRMAMGLGALGFFSLGVGLIMAAGAAPVLGAVVLLCTCAFGTWADVEQGWKRMVDPDDRPPLPAILAAPFVGAGFACLLLSLLMLLGTGICVAIYYTGAGICFAVGYFAKEALGKGGEHVAGVYAVYALLTLGTALVGLVFVSSIAAATAAMMYACIYPEWEQPDNFAKRIRQSLVSLAYHLLLSVIVVYLFAVVVLAGTGVYLACSALVH